MVNTTDGFRLKPTPEAPWYSALARYVEKRGLIVELRHPFTDWTGRYMDSLPCVFMKFPTWKGQSFVDDFGKKSAAMIDLEGEHVFAEIAILRLLKQKAWEGRWVNTYGGRGEVWRYLIDWEDVPRKEQTNRPIDDREAISLLQSVAAKSPSRFAGCWDVFAWRDGQYVFFEAKRQSLKYKDRVKDEQENWVRSALSIPDSPLTRESFCFVQWDYVAS